MITLNKNFTTQVYKHTKTNQEFQLVKLTDKLTREEFLEQKKAVKNADGFYSKFAKGFLIPLGVEIVQGESTPTKVEATPKKVGYTKNADLLEEYRQILIKNETGEWVEWYLKKYPYVIKIDGKIVNYEKPTIQTKFCFGYGQNGRFTDEEEDIAFSNMQKADADTSYFLNENLKELNSKIERLKKYLDNDYKEQNFYIMHNYNGIYCLTFVDRYNRNYGNELKKYNYIQLNKEQKQEMIDFLESIKTDFEKRLNTYLKRYGLSKLKTWTYLVD